MLHVASPFQLDMKEKAIIESAVKGTESILKACEESGVKKLVVTSSIVAIMDSNNMQSVFDESHFCDPNGKGVNSYTKSKILAEQKVWEFYKKLPNDSNLEIVTLCPGLILGIPY